MSHISFYGHVNKQQYVASLAQLDLAGEIVR